MNATKPPGPADTPCPVCGRAMVPYEDHPPMTPPRLWCPHLDCPSQLPPRPDAAPAAPADSAPRDSQPFVASRPELGAPSIVSVGIDSKGRASIMTAVVESFGGVPIGEFCTRDRARIEAMKPGMVGIAGLCKTCSAKIDAANPAEPQPGEHPAPWRWVVDDLGESSLWDALGAPLAVHASSAVDGKVAALIEAAPEMEALLRHLASPREVSGGWMDVRCRVCGGGMANGRCVSAPECLGQQARVLFARIDAAGK